MSVTLNGVALDWATCKITRHGGGGDIFAWAEFLVDPELLRCGSNDIGVAVLSRPSNLVASVVLQSVEMPRAFNAIVFDFDGLIVDTEVPEYEAWLGIFRSYGVDLPLSVWTPHIGGGHDGFDIYAHLAELTGMRVDRDELRDRRRSAFAELFKHAVPLPGVEDYIATARERGMRIGIASSSTHRG
ncbi:Putative phosphatase YhcW [Geodia barretti]|uniref:Phosphatase YhcW n=1 Tax=Geodia barretti TaxID=519541 RepID=A0AA35SZS6_GEOBA|nr:Putative phosphatase YhcW [Geodia barretti]